MSQHEYQVSGDVSTETPDTFGLGRTRGQRSAEIIAAIRAMLMPTPETEALTRMSGRVVAQMVLQLAGSHRSGANIIAVRTEAFSVIVKNHVRSRPDAVIVELAAGFTPRGVWLARDMPHSRVIEVDIPDVLTMKQNRLRQARRVTVPPNLEWRPADLSRQTLASALDGQKADVIVLEGLLPYFAREDVVKILRQVHDNLKPDGISVADILHHAEMEQVKRISAFSHFRRQAGSTRYAARTEAEVRELYSEAGYASCTVYIPSLIAPDWGLLTPVRDYSYFVSGRRGQA